MDLVGLRSTRGALSPLLVTGVFAALVGGAAALSVATAPPTGLFPAPFPNNPAAAASLRQATESTLASRSFTMLASETQQEGGVPEGGYTFRLIYQAPDRSQIDGHGSSTIFIGSVLYSSVPPNVATGTNVRWQALQSSPGMPHQQATLWLQILLHQTDVQRLTSDKFRTESFVTQPAITAGAFHRPSQVASSRITVVVTDGRIHFERITLVAPVGRAETTLTYTGFNTSPEVIAPPASEVSPDCGFGGSAGATDVCPTLPGGSGLSTTQPTVERVGAKQ